MSPKFLNKVFPMKFTQCISETTMKSLMAPCFECINHVRSSQHGDTHIHACSNIEQLTTVSLVHTLRVNNKSDFNILSVLLPAFISFHTPYYSCYRHAWLNIHACNSQQYAQDITTTFTFHLHAYMLTRVYAYHNSIITNAVTMTIAVYQICSRR